MPVYCYNCPDCKNEFEHFWPVDDYKNPTLCPKCKTIAEKAIWRQAETISCWSNERGAFTEGYDPALGEVVTGRKQRAARLKAKGLVEVGTDKMKKQARGKSKNYLDDNGIQDAVNRGAEISGQEADALKKGEKIHKD